MEYPLLAANNSEFIDEVFLSTDDDLIKSIGRKNGARIIDRPDYLCTKEALHQDAMIHGYNYIKEIYDDIEFIALIQCNAPCILSRHIDEGIRKLREDTTFDSVATVSKYNMFTPTRARRIDSSGVISNIMSAENIGRSSKINCDKDSFGDVFFTDGMFVVRPWCFEHIEEGMFPYQWMGRKSYAVLNWGGLDVDYAWQIPQVEFWLRDNGFTEDSTPYDNL